MNLFKYCIVLAVFSLCGCIVMIPPSITENPSEFRVSLEASPSDYVTKYLGAKYQDSKNFVLVFWQPACGASTVQTKNMNGLYEKYKSEYTFISVTTESEESKNKIYKQVGKLYRDELKSDTIDYIFDTYYDIVGMKSSIWNLKTDNTLRTKDMFVPINFIIRNDSIIHSCGNIYGEKEFEIFKSKL